MEVFAIGSCQTQPILFIGFILFLNILIFWSSFVVVWFYSAKGRDLRKLSCDLRLRRRDSFEYFASLVIGRPGCRDDGLRYRLLLPFQIVVFSRHNR